MVFFAAADMPPQAVAQVPMVLAATPAASTAKVRQKTFGVCELFYPTEDNRGEIHDSSVNSLHPAPYMDTFLPKKTQQWINDGGVGDWQWYAEWSESFKVTILRVPAHGKFVNLRNDPKLHDLQYLPHRDYIGKDRVDVLVEGKDDRGRPIALTIKYFINVLPEKELHRIVGKGTTSIIQAYKKRCGVGKAVWQLSENALNPRDMSDPSGQAADALVSLLTIADQNLRFTALPGIAVAQTNGTGLGAQINLDDDAAGYGWFIDPTPSDHAEFLPTSNPHEWIAKPGSDAAGKMDLLTVLWHETGHALGLEHTTDSHELMASTRLPGVRRLPSASEWEALRGLLASVGVASIPYDPLRLPGAPLPFRRSAAGGKGKEGKEGKEV